MGDTQECPQENRIVSGTNPDHETSMDGSCATVDMSLLDLATTMSMSLQPGSSSLLVLPNELLDHAFSFLDVEPPSVRNFTQLPSRAWTDQTEAPLKTLSVVSSRLRAIVLQRLFRYARIDPCHLTPLLEFMHRFGLAGGVESITAHVSDLHDCFHPAWYVRLLNEVPAQRLVVGCEPHNFAELTGVPLNLDDSWAFNVPYQYLELTQPTYEAMRQITYDYLPGLLGAKHWKSIRVNEGSSLAAYTSYEWFLKNPPSLMSNLHNCISSMPFDPENLQNLFPDTVGQVASIRGVLSNLQEFSFTAIFPFYNHVDNILKCIRKMRSLERLYIKLCPSPESKVLDEAVEEGHIDLNDPWNEWATKTSLLCSTLLTCALGLPRRTTWWLIQFGIWPLKVDLQDLRLTTPRSKASETQSLTMFRLPCRTSGLMMAKASGQDQVLLCQVRVIELRGAIALTIDAVRLGTGFHDQADRMNTAIFGDTRTSNKPTTHYALKGKAHLNDDFY